MTKPINSERLLSLDVLRGLVLFMLVFFQPLLWSIGGVVDKPWMDAILFQFEHEVWHGFHVWDMVMPMFMFMAGVTIPFSMEKYKDNRRQAYVRIVRRVLLLWVFGMIVQGNLLGLDPKYFRYYSNTLQAIASGYLVSSVLYLNLKPKWQVVAAAFLLLLYWAPATFLGDFTPEGNLPMKIDRAVLGSHMDGVEYDASGAWHFSEYYNYTWIFSSLTFAVTVTLGSFAGQIIRRGNDKRKNALKLIAYGVILVLVARLWDLQMPIIKKIWTCSMALYAGGFSFILTGLFHYLIDYKGWSSGVKWLRIYGMNSIVAYILGEAVNFRSVVESLSYGLAPYLGDWYKVWVTFGNFAIVFFILWILHKNRVFIRV